MIRRMRRYVETLGFRGLLYAIMSKVTRSTAMFTIHRPDCASPFRLRIPSSDVPTYKHVFLDKEYDFSVCSQPHTIVDGGANIGLVSIYFANKYPDARIIAIEPELSNFHLLEANTAPYPNITAIQAALWDKNEVVDLIDPGLGEWGFVTEVSMSSEQLPERAGYAVAAMTVDRLMEEYSIDRIDILKLDIEGAEREVFWNTSAWIDKVDAIIVELHEHLKPGCNRSFYCGSNGFDSEWKQGFNVYLSRANRIGPVHTVR